MKLSSVYFSPYFETFLMARLYLILKWSQCYRFDLNTIPTWIQHDCKMSRKRLANGSQMKPKWSQRDLKMNPKWLEENSSWSHHGPELTLKSYQNESNFKSNWIQHDLTMIPKWSQTYSKQNRNESNIFPECTPQDV